MKRRLASVVPLRVQQRAYRTLPGPVWRALRDIATSDTALHRRAQARRVQQLLAAAEQEVGAALLAVRYRGEQFAARPVDCFRAIDVLAETAAFVMDALEHAGVAYLVIDAQVSRRRVVAVAAGDRAAAWAALVGSAAGCAYYVRQVAPRARDAALWLSSAGDEQPAATAYTIFEVKAVPGSDRALSGSELGCVLEFWDTLAEDTPDNHQTGEPLPAGSWVAPRRNRWVDAVPHGLVEPTQWVVDGSARPALPTLTQQHAFDVDFPIDVVYTWVDGDDPDWQLRKSTAHEAVGLGQLNQFASNDSRFLSRDELRYSLRSLDMYASWVRRVYLVTDDQVPTWLDVDNPRIVVISHRELFGSRGKLPTFNSHSIESQLHHIPGLSGHFLYLNDDFFFGRPVEPRLFFHGNGLAKFFPSTAKLGLGPTGAFDRPVMSGGKNNRELIHKTFGRAASNKFKHVPQSLLKDVLAEMEERFPEEFEATASRQFRSPSDLSVVSSLHHHYAYMRGRAVEGVIRYFYADIAAPNTAHRLERLLRTRGHDTFCLNDHDSSGVDPAVQQQMMHSFLQRYFPLPSNFERS